MALVSTPANNLDYGAFSRNGTFEGDYNGIASAAGYSYITRDEAYPAYAGEPPSLTPDPSNPEQLALTGKNHQHQQTWVAVVGPATTAVAVTPAAQPAAGSGGAPAAPNTAAISTPNTSSASAQTARVTVLAVVLLGGVALVAGRRRRRT